MKNQTVNRVCRHYWLIETCGEDGIARGRCAHCGAEKDFYNFWPGDGPVATAKKRNGGRAGANTRRRANKKYYEPVGV